MHRAGPLEEGLNAGAFDPHDLLKLNAKVEAGVPLEEAAVSLGLVSEDDPLQERVLVDLRHELQLFNAPYFDVDADPERFQDPETRRERLREGLDL